ncbi:LD-carboxypeptidase [Arcanobacterium haemolyticum]|nr:LD-carboxypeptidase [Arcanobacterium haemolyticum]
MRIPPAVRTGDKVAVLSPAWAAPAYFPELHEQAMRRVEDVLGLSVVEFPTTRAMGASPQARAADINAAFADPSIRAIFSTVGGDDQICVIPYLDPDLVRADPKPFFGYSDNTNLLNWLWMNDVASYHGGSTMVHFGPGPSVDPEHLTTLRAALFGGGDVALPRTVDSQDYGFDWSDPRALSEPSPRGEALPVEFLGSEKAVRGATWGGCLEVIDQLALAGRLPTPDQLEGAILIFETSEVMPAPDFVGRWIRSMGERGYLEAAAGLAFARPVVSDRSSSEPEAARQARMNGYIEYLLTNISRYRSDLLVCLNLPFGHTRPQLVLPYGGEITLDPLAGAVVAHFPVA